MAKAGELAGASKEEVLDLARKFVETQAATKDE